MEPQEATTPEDVLSFWFDGDQSENHRSKWFPPDGSERQRAMDATIVARFGALLMEAERGALAHWCETRDSCVALILVLDQFSRHVHRGDATRSQIQANDAIAVSLSSDFVAKEWHRELPAPQFVFVLMPLRHSPTVERLHDVLSLVEQRQQLQTSHAELVAKFRKTTQNRLAHLRGDAALPSTASDDDILERHLVATDESDMPQDRLFRAMHDYLCTMKAATYSHMGVSLSGGVDSMVIAYLLHKLRDRHNDFRIVAVHLDYGNREESAAESEYVRRWCERFGIVFHVRRIDEIKRATTKRDDYERISREIRYATYAQVMAQYEIPGMCFGHHRGDVQENVISNMMKGLSLLNLNGMSASSMVNGVRIWRPLLAFDKDVILSFAHRYGVPYFKDTTPGWSTRGKLRNHLVPLLRDMYGDGFLANLSNLGAESTQCGEVINQSILAPILASVGTSEAAVWLDCSLVVGQPFFVWKEVLRTICHSLMGNAMVREKPIRELIAKLVRHRGAATGGQWITLKKGNRSYLTAERQLIVFRDRFFPRQRYVASETPLALGDTYTFGPWTVTTSLIMQAVPSTSAASSTVEGDADNALVQRWRENHVLSMWELVRAAGVVYVLPRAERLVVSSDERPPSLRMPEKAVTDAMPLVVTRGSTAQATDASGAITEFVKVQLSYCNRALSDDVASAGSPSALASASTSASGSAFASLTLGSTAPS